jgi:colicin import membrane protein
MENAEAASQPGAEGSKENSIPHSRVGVMVEKAKAETRAEVEETYSSILDQERRARAEAEARAAARPEAKPDITPEQLDAMVMDGRITETQKNAELERQRTEAANRRIDEQVEARVNERDSAKAIQTEIDAYTEAMPSLKQRTSDEFKRAGVEMAKLVSEGHPDTTRTEVLALRMAFGPVAALKRNPGDRETHEESGGGAGGDESSGGSQEPGGAPKGLDARRRAYYEKEIARGIYKGWDDPMVVRQLKRIGVGG